jgi:Cu-Zn family superoxide dismutase
LFLKVQHLKQVRFLQLGISIFKIITIDMRSNFSFANLIIGAALSTIVLVSCDSSSESETSTDTTSVNVEPSPSDTKIETNNAPIVNHAEAKLAGTYADTTVDGTVKFDTDSSGKVKMVLEITVLKKAGKSVAVHVHEHGNCGDTAMLAHGHWNPTNAQHGKWGSSSFHIGDIGNVKLNSQGKGTMTLTTDLWTLGGAADKNIIGKSIIIHGGVDDYTTQPTGNSGSRIGCGVIQ